MSLILNKSGTIKKLQIFLPILRSIKYLRNITMANKSFKKRNSLILQFLNKNDKKTFSLNLKNIGLESNLKEMDHVLGHTL